MLNLKHLGLLDLSYIALQKAVKREFTLHLQFGMFNIKECFFRTVLMNFL